MKSQEGIEIKRNEKQKLLVARRLCVTNQYDLEYVLGLTQGKERHNIKLEQVMKNQVHKFLKDV